MTFTEFTLYALEYDRQHHKERSGQSAFNALWCANPDLCAKVPDDLDPFYDSSRLLSFWLWVGENW